LDFDLSVYIAEHGETINEPSLFPSFEESCKDVPALFERAFSFNPERSAPPPLTRSNTNDYTPTTEFGTMSPIDLKLPALASVKEDSPAAEEPPRQPRGKRARSSSSTKTDEKLPPRPFNGTRNTKVPPVPVDAPTVSRKYVLPSATSRKEVPRSIARKRGIESTEDLDDEVRLSTRL
jgi:hypothetical protein